MPEAALPAPPDRFRVNIAHHDHSSGPHDPAQFSEDSRSITESECAHAKIRGGICKRKKAAIGFNGRQRTAAQHLTTEVHGNRRSSPRAAIRSPAARSRANI